MHESQVASAPTAGAMVAFFLAAGSGSRLGAITELTPKPMLRIGGRPILEHNLHFVRRSGITRVIINTHHHGDVIRDYFGDGKQWGVSITYSPEEVLLGTASAIRHQAQNLADRFVVLYADNLFEGSLAALLVAHQRTAPLLTIAVIHRSDVRASGEVVRDHRGCVLHFYEKRPGPTPRPGWVSAGLMVLERDVLARVPAHRQSDFGRDVIPSLLGEAGSNRVMATPFDGRVSWVDTPADLANAQRAFG